MQYGRGCLIPVAALLMAWPAAARADEKASAETDQKVYNVLRDVINHGADLYNINQDYAGCYRVYEGALTTLRPFLAHRPELQKAIGEGLENARKEPVMWRRAFVLRGVINKVRADVKGEGTAAAGKSLWDQLGGQPGVTKIVDDVLASAGKDPKVDLWRGKPAPAAEEQARFKEGLVHYVSSLTGGPLKYTGKDMVEAHKGLGITGGQFDAFVGHLKAALEKNAVPVEAQSTVLDAVNGVRDKVVQPSSEPVTLWQKLGGEKGVTAVVNDLFETAGKDPKVNFWRGKPAPEPAKAAEVKRGVVEYVSSVTGGPLKYTGKDMVEAHKGMGITNDEFTAFVGHLKSAMEKNKVPEEAAETVLDAVSKTRIQIVGGATPAKPDEGKKPEGDKPAEAKKPGGA